MITRVFLFAAASLAAASALAQDVKTTQFKTGFYVYGSIGYSMASGQATEIPPGATLTDDTDSYAGKVLVGYRFNKYFGIEGGYVDVAKLSATASAPGGGTISATAKLQGGQLAAIVWLPATDKLSLFGKLGGAAIRTKYEETGSADVKSTDIQTFFGLGLQYEFTKDLFGRAEYERYSQYGNYATGDISANVYSLGLGYKF